MATNNFNDCNVSDQLEAELDDMNGVDDDFEDWVEQGPRSKCLFCSAEFSDQVGVFVHCYQEHGFNIVAVKKQIDLDFYNYIKLVNYIRKEQPIADNLKHSNEFMRSEWSQGEGYLMPTMQEDDMLCFDIEADLERTFPEMATDGEVITNGTCRSTCQSNDRSIENHTPSPADFQALLAELKDSREKVGALQNSLESALNDLATMRTTARKLLDVDVNEKPFKVTNGRRKNGEEKEEEDDDDDVYFNSYSHWNIHESMLKDEPRTLAYKDSILLNSDLFSGKTVLDIGCGTSILSMFAARAGAERVIAVDQSKILFKAVEIVKENKLEHVIECIKGKIEDIELPVKEVDIIVSEWMGYFLLFESMLDSVLWARDRYLSKSGGLLFPNKCSMFLGGFESSDLAEGKVKFWDDVYGFRMSCMKADVLADATVEILAQEAIVTDICSIKDLDLMTCQVGDLEFSSAFELRPLRDGQLTGFFGFFETVFDLPNKVTLTTSPMSKPTHWQQTLFLLEEPVQVTKGQVVSGKLVCKKSQEDRRSLDVVIHFGGKKLRYYLD